MLLTSKEILIDLGLNKYNVQNDLNVFGSRLLGRKPRRDYNNRNFFRAITAVSLSTNGVIILDIMFIFGINFGL